MAMPIEKLDEMLQEESTINEESFRITDLKLAIWADEKAHDAEVKLQEIDTLADERIAVLQAKIDKLNEWREEAKRPYLSSIEFFKQHLLAYLAQTIREQIESGAKKIAKSVKLPFRTLQAKSQQPEIIKDDALLTAWADANTQGFVEYKPTLKWGELKKTLTMQNVNGQLVYVDENGEIVPHITLIERPDVLDWKVTG